MRLFEAIIEANHRGTPAGSRLELETARFAESLPIVALTCIDPRLSRFFPQALGVDDEQFIWLRNAGNIITGPLSSTMRSLALACAVKGGREIAVIGHSDCQVRKTGIMEFTSRFQALGIERARLPENLNEFFGLFSSERQNVIRAVDFVRQSPLIGPKIPVHGLLIDVESGQLEWIVNGYESFTVSAPAGASSEARIGGASALESEIALPNWNLGEVKFSEAQIGGLSAQIGTAPGASKPKTEVVPASSFTQAIGSASSMAPVERPSARAPGAERSPADAGIGIPAEEGGWEQLIDRARHYRVIGSDLKQYGPVLGNKVLQWLAEGRINAQSPVQLEGSSEWRPLAMLKDLALSKIASKLPLPPRLTQRKGPRQERNKGRGKDFEHGPFL